LRLLKGGGEELADKEGVLISVEAGERGDYVVANGGWVLPPLQTTVGGYSQFFLNRHLFFKTHEK
jgi:hypothetical protein